LDRVQLVVGISWDDGVRVEPARRANARWRHASGGPGSDGRAGDGGAALQASPLILTTAPAPREFFAGSLKVPTTIANSGSAAVPIELAKFYVKLSNGVLEPASGTESLVPCTEHFILLPGGSISCNLEFLANAAIASELRYDDGSTLPAVTAVTERPQVAGCLADEQFGSCSQDQTASAFASLSQQFLCAFNFDHCRAACLEIVNGLPRVSDCTCDAECLQSVPCDVVDSAIQSALTSCQPPP